MSVICSMIFLDNEMASKGVGCMSYLDFVCGYEDVKAELIRIRNVLYNSDKFEKMGVGMPHGLLLYGDHGMGKTLMAECFIKECDLPVFAISKEEPDCDVVNEIRCAFAEAKNTGKAIVFLDNLDDDADANVYAVLKACMDDCQKAGVFVFAIANDKDNIPDYLLRYGRFDKAIELDNPTAEDTEKILNCYLSQNNCAADVDVKEIAGIMRGNSCADLVMVVNEAAIYACENERKEITQEDLIRACLRKIFDTPEKVTQGNNMELLEATVHEAGHAVVAEIFSPGIVAVTSVRGQSGNCEGVTALKDADNDSGSKMEAMEHLIIRGLAGKAAIEIVLGRVDMGCASDLSIAFHRVERMVDNLCAFGFETYEGPQSSEAVRAKKEQLIATQMGMYYKAAKKILAEHRTFLDKVTEELMRSKILRQKDIKKIRDELAVG